MQLTKPLLGRQAKQNHPLTKGLVGVWLANENSGSTLFDLSGNGQDATLSAAGSSWATGKFGSAVEIDGVAENNGHITIPGIEYAESTILAWFYFDNLDATRGLFDGTGQADLDSYIHSGGHIYLYTDNAGPSRNQLSTGGIWTATAQTWHQVVLAFGTSYRAIFTDGILRVSDGFTADPLKLTIVGSIGNSYELDGKISHIMLWNRVLTPTEIAQLYQFPFCMLERTVNVFILFSPKAGIIVSPDFAFASVDGVDPTIVLGSLSLTPATVESPCLVVDPNVVLSSLALTRPAATAATGISNPTVSTTGNIVVSPVAVIARTATLHSSFSIYTSYGNVFLYTADNWVIDTNFYLEVYMKATSGTVYARLYNETDEAEVTDSGLSTTEQTFQRLRTSALTLTDGKIYRVQFGATGESNGEFLGGKLIAA